MSAPENATRRRGLGFNPVQVGTLEAQGWRAYYARRWARMTWLLLRLVHHQLGLPPLATLRAVRHGALAAVAFAPARNDPERARQELHRFYRVVQTATGLPFDPTAAGDAELDYWVIHRQVVGQEEREPLIAALARIPAILYDVPPERLWTSATERERAVRLVDRITGGVEPGSDAAWREIATALAHSHALLREAVAAEWASAPAEWVAPTAL